MKHKIRQSRFGAGSILLLLLLLPSLADAEMIMQTNGLITFQSVIQGRGGSSGFLPDHRSQFIGTVDFFRIGPITFNSPLGTMTQISRSENNWRLDRIWYSFAPGFRFERGKFILNASLHHDCIHVINQDEVAGSTWWNAFQFTLGTRESFHFYLSDYYGQGNSPGFQRLDGSLTLARYIKAEDSLVTGQNHVYRYFVKIRLRYPVYSGKKLYSYFNTDQRWWVNLDNSTEYKSEFSIHLVLKGRYRSLGIFYSWFPGDTYSKDSLDNLGLLGASINF